MARPHVELLLRKLSYGHAFSADEQEALAELPLQLEDVPQGIDIIREGDRPKQSCLIIDGFACSQKITSAGGRQILSFYVAGDIPDLQSLHLAFMDCGLLTLTGCRVAFISHASIRAMLRRAPKLADVLWRMSLVDASIFRQWIANLGQLDARSRVAHLLCEMMVRLEAVGLADGYHCYLPISQVELADATGISVVHINRTLQSLRQQRLLSLDDSELVVHDWQGLVALADFDPAYLHLERASDN